MNDSAQTLIIGLGNEFRSDDGVGRVVARCLRDVALAGVAVREESGEGAALLEAWKEFAAVILVDAVQSGAAPGTIHRFDASRVPVPSRFFNYSTHAFSVAEAVELARALQQLPPQTILYGVEGRNFAAGESLSPEVAAVLDELLDRVRHEIQSVMANLNP